MTTITQTIPSLGSPPLTSDPSSFDTRADTLYGTSLPAVISATNTWSGQANTVAGEVNTDKLAAAVSAAAAAVDAGDAQSAATQAAASASFQGEWAGLVGDLDLPASVRHNNIIWLLLTYLPDVTDSEPGVTADWAAYKQIAVNNRTSNTILTANDFGAFIRYTSGTFTQTFSAVATLGVGWFVWLKNAGTGDITLNPNASEQIDGLTDFILYPNELRLVMVNAAGTGFDSFVYNGFQKVFTTSGTFTKPPGYKTFEGIAISGGASGGRGNNTTGGAGGGAFPFTLAATSFGATETITIGAGGAARTTNGNGNAGGATSIGSLIVVLGGTSISGGAISVSGSLPARNGAIATGFEGGWSSSAGSAIYGGASSYVAATAAGSSIFGGGAGGCISSGVAYAAGTSLYAGDGGASATGTDGTDGDQPGGGGGATESGTTSGAGGDGQVTIRGMI
jgi:hypothetical protein